MRCNSKVVTMDGSIGKWPIWRNLKCGKVKVIPKKHLHWRVLGVGGWRKQNNKATASNSIGFQLGQCHNTEDGECYWSERSLDNLEKMALMVEASMTTSLPAPRLFLHLPITCLRKRRNDSHVKV